MQSVKKEIVVNASQERAFRVFAEETTAWWPKEHHIGDSPAVREVIEPSVGGRWFSVNEDGSETNVGRVLVWEPFARLTLSWQINAAWQFDPDFVTEVEVRFEMLSPDRTRVMLEHKNLHRFGVQANTMRDAFESDAGWGQCLHAFAVCAEKSDARAA